MATHFFLIGYNFEEFRNQEAIRKKISLRPGLDTKVKCAKVRAWIVMTYMCSGKRFE